MTFSYFPVLIFYMSLSARRAWIEIHDGNAWVYGNAQVALRKESVDRNTPTVKRMNLRNGRSPQGERG